ncbi:MAG TPA: hypothetical protein VGO62_19790, partial [Myxococcota bacterium]
MRFSLSTSLVAGFVVLIPFTAHATPKRVGVVFPSGDVKDAVEMALGDAADPHADDTLAADLNKLGKRAWTPSALAPVLQARGLDAVVRGEHGSGKTWMVGVYGPSGALVSSKEIAASGEPEAIAGNVIGALGSVAATAAPAKSSVKAA